MHRHPWFDWSFVWQPTLSVFSISIFISDIFQNIPQMRCVLSQFGEICDARTGCVHKITVFDVYFQLNIQKKAYLKSKIHLFFHSNRILGHKIRIHGIGYCLLPLIVILLMSIRSLNGITTGMFIHDIDIIMPRKRKKKKRKGKSTFIAINDS